jgi:hypothetical protein
MPQFFTAYAAADLLERDQRTIRRAMRGIAAEHVDDQGHAQWRLRTIVEALQRHSGDGQNPDVAAITEIEAAGKAVEAPRFDCFDNSLTQLTRQQFRHGRAPDSESACHCRRGDRVRRAQPLGNLWGCAP